MKIVSIFVDPNSSEGIYSIVYPENGINEFERLLDLWNDTEYVTNYCYENKAFLSTPYFGGASIDQTINKIRKEAEYLEEYLLDFTEDSFENAKAEKLQSIFVPLKNKESNLPILQETKFRYSDRKNFPLPILRIYALRIAANTFIITGGCIKFTQTMAEHPDSDNELKKIEAVRKFLLQSGITDEESLIYYYEPNE